MTMAISFAKSDYMTDASTISRASLSKTVVGMAHFADTGPAGATCDGCAFWKNSPVRKKPTNICHKFMQMTGDGMKAVPANCAACRYFEARKSA